MRAREHGPGGRPAGRSRGGRGSSDGIDAASRRVAALALLLGPVLALAGGDAGATPDVPAPIGWHEPAPFARLFLQLPFEAPEVVPAGGVEASVSVLYSNSVLQAEDGAYRVDVHVETAQPTLALRYGIAPRVEVALGIPFVGDGGGFLDRPIEAVERWFRASNPDRIRAPVNQAWFRVGRAGFQGIDGGPGAGLGDVWGAVKVLVAGRAGGGGSLALRAAVKLPTGRLPYGSEELDAGGGVLAAWTWRTTALRVGIDAFVPTRGLAAVGASTRAYGAADVAVTQRLGDRVALHAQASAHTSPLTGTGLDPLDRATAYVLLGATVQVSRTVALQAGVVENVFSPFRGADITFPFALAIRP